MLTAVISAVGLVMVGLAAPCLLSWIRHAGITPRVVVLAWYLLLYALVPIFVTASRTYWNPRFYRHYEDGAYMYASALSVVGLVLLLMVMSAIPPLPQKDAHRLTRTLALDSRMIHLAVLGTLGVVAFVVLSGGLSEVTANISELRSTSDGSLKRVLAAVLFMGRNWVLVCAIYFTIASYGETAAWHRRAAGICWGVTLAASLVSGGRMSLINVLIGGFLALVSVTRHFRPIRVLMTLVAVYLVSVYGKSILFQLGRSDFDRTVAERVLTQTRMKGEDVALVQEFSHPYLSLVQSVELDYQHRLFGDYWYWAAKPFALFGMDPPDSVSYFNTWLTWGAWDSEVPPGILGFGYLSFALPGVIFHVLIVALIISLTERALSRRPTPLARTMTIYSCLAFPVLVFQSDPALFIQNQVIMLLPLAWAFAESSARRAGQSGRRSPLRPELATFSDHPG